MTTGSDIAAGRLGADRIAEDFAEIHPPLDRRTALIESSRCYFCYDAPCIEACPTGIDIPAFIKGIATDNVKGAAQAILAANIMGGMCARVCPVEELCEDACVRNHQEEKPVAISALQRYATDHVFLRGEQLFSRAPSTGKRVAVVGAGPAGLACAHRLAMLGHDVVVFEAKAKGGGLNEYGLAAYKMADGFAQAELAYILEIGGIEIRTGMALGRDISLSELRREYDAVFLGLGHNAVNALGCDGEALAGVESAVDFIARLRQAADKRSVPVGRRVVVIGGGNTAIDAATQAKRLGAEEVTLVYRRGAEQMSATWKEQDWTQVNGVTVRHWAQPRRILGWPANGKGPSVKEIEFEHTQLDAQGRLAGTGDRFTLLADQVFTAIGQYLVPSAFANEAETLDMAGNRIAVNEEKQTSLSGVWAGGDCVPGQDLTVSAVQDGKLAALSIDRALRR
ncbi:NAD(P)-dependent oxidoreductase [Inquilinus limosus]|uniref:dihydrouracil dehydrogenase (NAD(+)) n=1 Tax=Inquilinus limosus MP06 TaxID=1398085 RepID=A0A0A0D841_9PROT|nr:NAD(P)-dependent oxidoreductase [Inquilinus limosus]KGM34003.1 dihydropyrimidine dehydrogenase [Inquilinus limosus MP06]